MNAQKAKEYFSAYCDGTLERGLKQQFERTLEADASLKMEFEAFRAMLGDLGSFKDAKIVMPADLNEKIQARLDRHIWEEQQKKPAPWTFWIRNLGFAGLGALAIFGAINGINARGATAQSGVVGEQKPAVSKMLENQLVAKWESGQVKLSFKPTNQSTIVVRSGDGTELKRVTLDGAEWQGELTNPNTTAAVFNVDIDKETGSNLFVVPGSQRSNDLDGNGNLLAFATAVANAHGVPVWVRAQDPATSFSWTLKAGVAATDSINQSVSAPAFRAEMLEGGIISLRQS